ncbi:MAG: pitrilysin family protein [Ottowia sp.]|nr:insulinase family protein [Ottowia sp.]
MSRKNLAALALAVLACVLLATQALAAIPIQHWTQASGAGVWFVPSPTLPILDVQIDFDAGDRRDPPQQSGLASATAQMLGKGVAAADGQPALDESELEEAWADLAASFDGSASRDRMSFSLRTLTDPKILPQAVALAARELGHPSWPEKVWDREREQWSAAIRESLTRPGTVAARAFRKAVYGSHPYGVETEPETLERVGVSDMRDFYAMHVRPCHARVSVVGAISREQADQLVQQLLAPLAQDAACPELPAVPEVAPLTRAEEIRIPFASAQTHVLIGQPGYKRDDPAFFALLVGNHILGGGGFTSRLTQRVREDRGLSYSVYSAFSPGRHAGAFSISLETRPDQAGEALQVSRDVLDEFVAEGPTDTELQAAQDNLTGSFPLRLDSNRKLLANVANIAWNGLPLDYLEHWTDRISAVTREEITQAFQRVLQPQREVTVVVGPDADSVDTDTAPQSPAPAD